MEEAKETIKKVFEQKFSPKYRKRLIFVFLGFISIPILLASAVYYITVDDGTYKEDDWSSTPYGASQYTQGISIEKDGTLKSSTTAQELWDKMLKNKSRVKEYLSNPQELARLMRAEIITQYPDTRPNPDKEINWEQVIENEDLMQGIIKFKRADPEGNKSTMSYVDPETFQGYIDEYNRSGSESAKQNALKHFTLKKAAGSSSSSSSSSKSEGGVNYNGPELYWPTTATYISSPFGYRGEMSVGTANHNGIDIAGKAGDEVYACEDGKVTIANYSDSAGNWVVIDHGRGYITKYMHNSQLKVSAGDTVKKGQVIALEGSTGWSTGPHVHFQIEYNGVPVNPLEFKYHNGQGNGTGGFGISDDDSKDNDEEKDEEEESKDNKKDEKNKEDKKNNKKDNLPKATATPVDGDGYKELYTSSAGITYKHYKQFEGSYAGNSYWGTTIAMAGCGPSSVAILASGLVNTDYDPGKIAGEMNTVYGYTSYETLQKEMNSLGMESEVIQTPSAEVIKDNLKNGKVMLVSVDSNTIFTNESHLMALVDINEQGQVYICNPGSSTLHGWYDIGAIMAGCQYIVVTDGGEGGAVAPSEKKTSNYVAVVATWKQVDTTVTGNDPNAQPRNITQYTMTTTNVNYEEMVDPYTMPFDLLWALLVVGEDKKFVFELADLIYHSDIQITIHDNLTVNTDIDEWHYTLRTKAEVDAKITATCEGNTAIATLSNDVHDPHSEEEYTTTKTIVTQTNTLTVDITKANVWIVDYQNEYTYLGTTEGEGSSNRVTKPDQSYPQAPDRTENSYSCDHIAVKRAEASASAKAKAEADTASGDRVSTDYPVTLQEEITAKYYSKYINIYDNISHSITTQKYIKGAPNLVEKVDEETKPNFVTIFNKAEYRKNKINIKNADEWLFEIIETNDSTADMWPDLIRYLLYKATGIKYDGVDEFDFSIFKAGSFKKISGGGGNLDIKALTETNLSEEEFVELVQGYSDAISKGAGTADFRNNAKSIYQVCVQNHINPVFCAAQGWREQNWIAPNTSPYNYWGIAVYNNQNYGSSWPNIEAAVQGYCDQVNSQATNNLYLQRAKEYAAIDSRFKGDMSTIYDVFSAYLCLDNGTKEQNAKYVGDYIDSLSTIAQQIFGVGLE